MSTRTRDVDKPYYAWSEVLVSYEEGCVVHLPHTSDRLDIGLAAGKTEWGWDADLEPGYVEIDAVWGHLLTIREQWEYVHDTAGKKTPAEVPEDWFPPDGVPSWQLRPAGEGDEIWTVMPLARKASPNE